MASVSEEEYGVGVALMTQEEAMYIDIFFPSKINVGDHYPSNISV